MDFAGGAKCYRKIVINGVVQGVGFRPFVLRLARGLHLTGTVRNLGGAVLIFACGDSDIMELFINCLKEQAPIGARILEVTVTTAEPFCANSFEIIESETDTHAENVFVSPDLSICGECLRDLSDEQGRRFRHPFNSCVDCGPRFSIIERLPYDRENTSMKEFPLCKSCDEEYTSTGDRRCHAQTVCCNGCGPVLKLKRKNRESIAGGSSLARAVESLERGEIIAIKGVGGYHFACSPYNNEAVGALRKLKGRDKKPFAVMFRNIAAIRKICFVSEAEENLLESSARPITLLELKSPHLNERETGHVFCAEHTTENHESDVTGVTMAEETLCGDIRCGCFLPYTALHALLLESLEALVLTSANPGGNSIFTDDAEMLDFLNNSSCEKFTGMLYHDRKIIRAAEDSVAQVTGGQAALLRRSRGYVPAAVKLENRGGRDFLAMGGDLKSAFCFVKNSYAYQGPYTGDLAEKSVYDRFRASIHDFGDLLGIKPEFVVCDSHPNYISSALAEETGLPVIKVQHHHAHIASVMAEHDLHQKVLGIAFDGTGYGDDGCIWGGEFLVCEGKGYRRAGRLAYTTLLGGDSSVNGAKKTAFCFLRGGGLNVNEYSGQSKIFDDSTEIFEAALNAKINTVESSSMGRLFDAAAGILGLGFENSYEGECAVLLQRCAEQALRAGTKPYPLRFDVKESDGMLLADAQSVACELFYKSARTSAGALALGFHFAAAELVKSVCIRLRELEVCDIAALSGGVFQNGLLLRLTREKLIDSGFRVYTNQMSVPNDGGISLGQAYIGNAR